MNLHPDPLYQPIPVKAVINGDSPTSLSLSEQKGVYHCHVCHASGDKLDFIQRTMNVSFAGALSLLGIQAEKRQEPDPPIVRQREAMRRVRDWCRQTRLAGMVRRLFCLT